MRMGGLSAPAALDSSGTDATLASNPILSFANAIKRASSVPAGTVSVARAGGGGEAAAGVACGWVAITLPAASITPACAVWQTAGDLTIHRHPAITAERPAAVRRREGADAVSLRMAIFRYQPSPFCILDEVDAPLDEPNIERLTRLLKEMSMERSSSLSRIPRRPRNRRSRCMA